MPAAAVIPAPIAYIKVVAVKKLVVENLLVASSLREVYCDATRIARLCLHCWVCYFEKIRVFQAGLCLEYFSME